MSVWAILTDAAILVALITAVLFPALYLRSPWRSTLPGRSIMLFSVIIAGIFVLIAVRTVFRVELPEYVRTIVYVLIAAATTTQLLVLLRVQRRGYEPNLGRRSTDTEEVRH